MLSLDRRAPARSRLLVGCVIAATVVIAALVRFVFVNQISGDYRTFVGPWYDQLKAGGFSALGGDYSNYNPPYLYLLALLTHLPVPKIIAIKSISMVFDLLLAMFAALIVRERFPRPALPLQTFALVLFAPTVVVNSAAWGQCDSIYAAFCLGSLYFLITRKPWWACVFFALGLSFKLQAIFFLPVLLIVMVVNRQRWTALLAVPAVFALMLVPAALAGRDISSLLSIYSTQVSGGGTSQAGLGGGAGAAGGGGGGGVGQRGQAFGASADSLTLNAPTFYQWVSAGASSAWKYVGLAAAAVVVAVVGALAWLRRRPLYAAHIVILATTVVLAVPFLLPQMHERYFYLADVLTIVMAMYVRRFWPVAIVVSLCSLLSYAPFLWNATPVALPLVAFGEFLAVIVTIWIFFDVFRDPDQESGLLRHPARSAESS